MSTRPLASQVLYQPSVGAPISVQQKLDSLGSGGGGGGGSQFVTVSDYGADATGATSSVTAFNAAATAAASGLVVIPAGTYLLDAPVSPYATWWLLPGAFITGLASTTDGLMNLSRLTGYIVHYDQHPKRSFRVGAQSNWLEGRWNYSQAIAELASVSRFSEIGVLGASRTSDNPAQTLGSIGVAAFSVNDSTSPKEPAWGAYIHHQKVAGSGPSYGLEIDNVNQSGTFNATPYNMGDGMTSDRAFNLWLTCGAGDGILGAGNAVSAAMAIAANPTPFNRGIIFPSGCVNLTYNEIITSFNGGRIAWYDYQGGVERLSGWVSSAGPVAGLDFTIRNQVTGTYDQGMRLDGSLNTLRPFTDTFLGLGTSSHRFREIYGVMGLYGDVGYVELPTSIGPGSNSGIPNRSASSLTAQLGTVAAPLTNSTGRAFSSQAVVAAPYPWSSPSHWSPNEVSVINKGTGRVNAFNSVLITDLDLNMDNTAIYNYAKASYAGSVSGAGGVVGYWSIVDTRGSRKRGVGAEFVMLHDSVDRYDINPKSGLSDNAEDAVNGAFHAGVRISTLLSSKVIARGLDFISDSDLAGFDTGINIQAFRSRGIYIHNTLNASKGGNRYGIELADSISKYLKFSTTDLMDLSFEQNYSGSLGTYYYTFRRSASFAWASFYSSGLVTLSNDASTGAKLQVNPDGAIFAGHTTATSAGFHVPNTGKFWLSGDKNTYLTFNGTNVLLVKNGATVATW